MGSNTVGFTFECYKEEKEGFTQDSALTRERNIRTFSWVIILTQVFLKQNMRRTIFSFLAPN